MKTKRILTLSFVIILSLAIVCGCSKKDNGPTDSISTEENNQAVITDSPNIDSDSSGENNSPEPLPTELPATPTPTPTPVPVAVVTDSEKKLCDNIKVNDLITETDEKGQNVIIAEIEMPNYEALMFEGFEQANKLATSPEEFEELLYAYVDEAAKNGAETSINTVVINLDELDLPKDISELTNDELALITQKDALDKAVLEFAASILLQYNGEVE